MRRGLWLVLPTVLVGVVAAIVTLAAHQGDAAFVFEQQHPAKIEPSQLESIVEMTREPTPAGSGSTVVSVHCLQGHSGPKLNPWLCTVRYGSGDVIRYQVTVQPSGRFQGVDRTGTRDISPGTRVITGCCLRGGVTAASG